MGSNRDVEIYASLQKNSKKKQNEAQESIKQITITDILTVPYAPVMNADNSVVTYPAKSLRYNRLGWNKYSQHCYTVEDVSLINRIITDFSMYFPDSEQKKYFELVEQQQWSGWWSCTQPQLTSSLPLKYEGELFTLPSRAAKDSKTHPLWTFADNMARMIGNWQADRVKNQNYKLMNDPVMLVFEELKNWFFNELSEKECNKFGLESISKRQSYIKSLIHYIPHFGPDRFHLHDIQGRLDHAVKKVLTCVANKDLPQLLSDIINSGKSLETIIGTYLHFLLVNEEVSDNFSTEYVEPDARHCYASPLCKITRAVSEKSLDEINSHVPSVNRYYQPIILKSTDDTLQLQLQLKVSAMDIIQFPSFATQHDKQQYFEAIAALESLRNIRIMFEKFQYLQSSLGIYIFAAKYLEKTNELAAGYTAIIHKIKTHVKNLIKTSDEGLNVILNDQDFYKKKDFYFEKNLRALETQVAKGTTVNSQLDSYCANTIENINKHQQFMQKLSLTMQEGKATQKLAYEMQDLYRQMYYLNNFLPALVDNAEVTISHNVTLPDFAQDVSYEKQCPDHMYCPTNLALKAQFDYGKWDYQKNRDAYSQQPIFTFRIYKNDLETGSIELFGQPMLCKSQDGQRNNIMKTSGVLNGLTLPGEADIDKVCEVLPISYGEKIIYSAGNGALYGMLRGGTNVLSATMQSRGVNSYLAGITSQAVYYGCIFSVKYTNHYMRMQHEDIITNSFNAIYQSAIETGQILVTNIAISTVAQLLERASGLLSHHRSWLGKGLKKCSNMVRHGFFALQAVEQGPVEASIALGAGVACEVLTQRAGKYIVNAYSKTSVT